MCCSSLLKKKKNVVLGLTTWPVISNLILLRNFINNVQVKPSNGWTCLGNLYI